MSLATRKPEKVKSGDSVSSKAREPIPGAQRQVALEHNGIRQPEPAMPH